MFSQGLTNIFIFLGKNVNKYKHPGNQITTIMVRLPYHYIRKHEYFKIWWYGIEQV